MSHETCPDWASSLAAGPGQLWLIPEPEYRTVEPAIPMPADLLAAAEDWDAIFTTLVGVPSDFMATTMRLIWLIIFGPRWCDCPVDPHHLWNCRMTPIWAQTIRDLDTNPWTVMDHGGRWRAQQTRLAIGRVMNQLNECGIRMPSGDSPYAKGGVLPARNEHPPITDQKDRP